MVSVKDLKVLNGSGRDEAKQRPSFILLLVIEVLAGEKNKRNSESTQSTIDTRSSKNASESKRRPRPLGSGLETETSLACRDASQSQQRWPTSPTF